MTMTDVSLGLLRQYGLQNRFFFFKVFTIANSR